MPPSRWLLVPVLAFAACQSEPAEEASCEGEACDDAPAPASCDADYPTVFSAAPGRAKELQTELTKLRELAPDTEGDIDPTTGALSFLATRIPVSFDGKGTTCEQAARAFTALATEREALFRIDPDGFEILSCQNVGDLQFVSLQRPTVHGMPVIGAMENLAIQFAKTPAALVSFQGFYLPSGAEVAARQPCFTKKQAAKLPVDREIPLQTFLACVSTGSGSYTIKSSDKRSVKRLAVVLQPTPDQVSGLEVRLAWEIEVDVAAKNVTDELRASDAACADADGTPRIGWKLTIDAVTGELLFVGHHCIVC